MFPGQKTHDSSKGILAASQSVPKSSHNPKQNFVIHTMDSTVSSLISHVARIAFGAIVFSFPFILPHIVTYYTPLSRYAGISNEDMDLREVQRRRTQDSDSLGDLTVPVSNHQQRHLPFSFQLQGSPLESETHVAEQSCFAGNLYHRLDLWTTGVIWYYDPDRGILAPSLAYLLHAEAEDRSSEA